MYEQCTKCSHVFEHLEISLKSYKLYQHQGANRYSNSTFKKQLDLKTIGVVESQLLRTRINAIQI